MDLNRVPSPISLTLDTASTTTPKFPFGNASGGTIHIPAGSTITTLTFYAAANEGDTYVQIFDSSNVAVSRTVAASRAYALPDECFGVAWLKIVANAAGAVTISLKN